MGLSSLLPDSGGAGGSRRQRVSERVTECVESGVERVDDASQWVRSRAGDRAADVVDRRVDELRVQVQRRVPGDLRSCVLDRTVDELLDRVLDDAVDERRRRAVRERIVEAHRSPAGSERSDRPREPAADIQDARPDTEPSNRDAALERFLRRYGLDPDRIDDETLRSIRRRVPWPTGETSASTDGPLDPGPADRVVTAAADRLRTDLDVETDQPLAGLVRDVLGTDAVALGHAIEGVLAEEVPGEVGAQDAGARGDGRSADRTRPGSERGGADRPDSTDAAARSASFDDDDRAEPTDDVDRAAPTDPSDRPGLPEAPSATGERSIQTGTAGRSAVALATAVLVAFVDDGEPPLADAFADPGDPVADGPLESVLAAFVNAAGIASDEDLGDEAAVASEAGGDGGWSLLPPDDARTTGSRALVGLFVANLAAMLAGAWLSHERAPPIPDEIRGPDGEPIVTEEQVRLGKKAFQANGLMNHGSVLGNGSYFGVDLTADALSLKVQFMREYYARERGAASFDVLDDGAQAAVRQRVERELDADAPEGAVATYSAAERYAHEQLREQYVERYHEGAPERGLPAGFVESAELAERIADFACWTAWMAHTNRPGSDHSYTNDWPYVPGTGNRPTGQVLVWSTISVVLLVAGGGAGVWAYHALDVAEPATEFVDVPSPDTVSITPTQYVAAWYVPVAGALFVAQALVGAVLAHYYVERTGFYGIGDALGIDVVSLLPFSTGRTWHVNLGVLWITTLWLAGGLFLPGLFADEDLPGQSVAASVLLGLLVVATVGAFAGVWLGQQGLLGSPADGERWWWFGTEGLEYLETGRFWKLGLLAGFVGWTGLVLRSVRRLDEPSTGLGHLMGYAGGSIALMFGASMLYTPETNIAITEFWRWWVVHMWVEGVFEFFVTAVVSVALVSMDLIDRGDAERAILFEVFAIMAAGIVGVSHHYWWVGLPDVWVPLGTTFSTLEFVPLVFVLYRGLGEYRSLRAQGESFPYALPLLFLVGSSLWNFVGGGVLGFFINLPVINYYEHGTYLTVAHAHTATFGAFGLLALGLGTYVLRVVTPEAAWEPGWFRGSFWLTNVGLTIMTAASLLPVGFEQLRTAYREGYAAARSLEFYEQEHVQTLLWARTLGDTPMILGALAFTVGAVRHLLAARADRSDSAPERWRPVIG